MQDKVRSVLIAALQAGSLGVPLGPKTSRAIANGEAVTLAQLDFDSLAWLEFCISVELQSGQELGPEDIEKMVYISDLEAWLRTRL